MTTLYVSVPVGNMHGAGVMGTNLVPALAKHVNVKLLAALPIGHPLTPYIDPDYNQERPYAVDGPMLHLATGGASFLPFNRDVWSWNRNVGYIFIEFPRQARSYAPHGHRYYNQLVAGSTWCRDKLIEMGFPNTTVAIQGIDFETFRPDPDIKPLDDGKFYIFSGGKAEYRKGTDIVIAAFKILSEKHKDMHLVAAWGNHWLQTMDSLSASPYIKWVASIGADWQQRLRSNMTFHGILNDRYTILPFYPNSQMADIYRRCHLGVFPNRCEAGTNMVMTEFMACGVPVVATRATGHIDVINHATAYCANAGIEDDNCFFEPSLEGVIAEIEYAYAHRSDAIAVGKAGKDWVGRFTWDQCAVDLLTACV